MKKLFWLLLLLLVNSVGFSQTPQWQWARDFSGTGVDQSHTIVLDNQGDLIVGGRYTSTITIGTNTFTNHGGMDCFVAKYDTLGNNIWAFYLGGSGDDEVWDVITDNFNNVIVTGWFKSSSFIIGDTTFTNSGEGNLFIAKFDPDGNYLWAERSTGSGREWGRSLGMDDDNNIYLGGNFINGDMTFLDTTLDNSGSYDMFVAKLKPSGEKLWIRHTGGSGMELLRNLAVSSVYQNVYILGDFTTSTITFGDTVFNCTGSNRDNFVVKYDNNGEVVWARHIKGSYDELGSFITVDWKENIYITGQYKSAVCTFDGLQLTNTSTTSSEVYLAMYDIEGVVQWVTGLYGEDDDVAYCITSDLHDGIYICGWFSSNEFGIGTDELSAVGGFDVFVSKFDFYGNYYWTKQCGKSGSDYAEAIISDADGNLFVSGYYQSSSIDFDDTTLYNSGSDDVFIARLSHIEPEGVDEFSRIQSVEDIFFPNPASEKIYFKEKQWIKIFSMTGDLVIDSYSDIIDISHLNNGIYCVLTSGKTQKLVKY